MGFTPTPGQLCDVAAPLHGLPNAGDGDIKAVAVPGFEQVVERREVEGLHRVRGVGGDEDHQRPGRLRQGGESVGHRQTIRARHLNVEEYHIHRVAAEYLQGRSAVAGFEDGTDVGKLFEKAAQFGTRRCLVVHHQHTPARRGRVGEVTRFRGLSVHRMSPAAGADRPAPLHQAQQQASTWPPRRTVCAIGDESC